MPRDPRPYTTYPLNYSTHPRWEGLSDAAFRTLHEMQDHSRVHGMDGLLPFFVAHKRWKLKVLDELVAGAPGTDRPLLERTPEGYFIRSYAEHQFTTADAAELREARARAGAAGGRAKASNRLASATANGKQVSSKNVARSESESELRQTDDGDSRPPVTEVDARVGDGDEEITPEDLAAVGIRNLDRVRAALERVVGPLTPSQAIDVTRAVILLANEPVRSVEAYVEAACVNSPAEVRVQFEARRAVWP